jgi:hypothetical protein
MKATDFCFEFCSERCASRSCSRSRTSRLRETVALHLIIPTENHIMRIRKTARTSNLCGAFASMATGAVKLHDHFVSFRSCVSTADQKQDFPPRAPLSPNTNARQRVVKSIRPAFLVACGTSISPNSSREQSKNKIGGRARDTAIQSVLMVQRRYGKPHSNGVER